MGDVPFEVCAGCTRRPTVGSRLVRVWMAWHGGGDLWTPMLVTSEGEPDPSWLTLARAWVDAVREFAPASDERWTWQSHDGCPWDYRLSVLEEAERG